MSSAVTALSILVTEKVRRKVSGILTLYEGLDNGENFILLAFWQFADGH